MLRAYYYSSSSVQILTRYSPAPFVTDPRNRRQIVRPIEEWRAMTFISDRAYDDRTVCEKSGEKSHRQCIAANFDES